MSARGSYGLAGAWIATMVALEVVGCPCLKDGTCVEPWWVGAFSVLVLVASVTGLVGLFRRRTWGASAALVAALAALPPSAWEIGHAPLIGIGEVTGFLFLAGWAVALRLLAGAREDRWDLSLRDAAQQPALEMTAPVVEQPAEQSVREPERS